MIRSGTRMLVTLALASGLLAPIAALAAEELNLFAWSEYVPQSVLDGFTKETGIQVNYESYASNEEMLAKLMSGAGADSRVWSGTNWRPLRARTLPGTRATVWTWNSW